MDTEREMRRAGAQAMKVGDMSSEVQISIIDDDERSRAALAGLMQAMGFTIEAFPSAIEFQASPNFHHTSCLIVDVHMPRSSWD